MESACRQRVGLVPARYLDNPEVGALELAVLFILCAHANRLGVCWPSQATIAAKAKLDRGTVNRILAKLAALGLVEKGRHPNPRIRACTYRLVGHETLLGTFSDGTGDAAEGPVPMASETASGVRSKRWTISSAPELPSMAEWWTLVTTPMRFVLVWWMSRSPFLLGRMCRMMPA